jgi:hypothetical protein
MPKSSDPITYPDTQEDYDLKKQRDRNYSDSIYILQDQWLQADYDQRFYLGDQEIWGSLFPSDIGKSQRRIFNFNIINPIIQSISGHQRQTRKSTVSVPIQTGSQKTSDQITKCLYYVHNQSGAYQVYSDAFEQGALTQGIGLVSIFKDMTSDPVSGDIKLRYVDFKSIIIDPFFRRHDLSDCRFIWTRQFFDRDELYRLYPDMKKKLSGVPLRGFKDDKFYFMPEMYQIQFPNLVAFDEYWYLSTRKALYLVDTETNEMQEFTGDEEDMRVVNMHFGGRLKLIKKEKPTVRRQVIINDKTVIDEDNPYGIDRYPYVPFLGYFCPDSSYYSLKFRGVVRDMRDAQYLFNRRKVADLDILEAQQQGLIVKKGTLVTPEDSLNAGNGRVLVRKEGSTPDDITPMQIIPPSPVMLQMEEMLMQIAHRIAGVDPSAMGIDVDDKAGIITMMRQAATARNLQRLFDQLDEAQRLCGEIIVEMIQKNWTYTKVKSVIGEEPTQEFENKLFFKYACKIIQAPLTETQQQLELGQLLNLQQMFGENTPPPVYKRILDAMFIQNKAELQKDIEQYQQQQAQQQQQMQQLQMQQMQVDNETKLSYAESQKGLAAERSAKINTDIAIAEDKLKRAHTEDTASLLNLIKAIKELDSMDLQQLERKLIILQSLQPTAQETPTAIGGLRSIEQNSQEVLS